MKKVCYNFLFISFFVFCISNFAYTIQDCRITPKLYEIEPLPHFYDSNNLRYFKGSLGRAAGTPVVVRGYVYDERCVPIPNAVVELWHKNYSGVFNYDKESIRLHDPNFTGSGTANTNNLGEFVFYTIFPGTTHVNEIPFLNFRVRHSDFPILETRFFFEDHKRGYDPLLSTLPHNKRYLLMAKRLPLKIETLEYEVFMVLDGRNKYKFK